MFFKLILFLVVAATATYYYDQNTAEKKVIDAEYVSMDTDFRCKQSHESMCKYFMTVKLPRENLTYTFRVPQVYYHAWTVDQRKGRRYPVIYKAKKILPAAVLGLAPKFEAEIDPLIKADG